MDAGSRPAVADESGRFGGREPMTFGAPERPGAVGVAVGAGPVLGAGVRAGVVRTGGGDGFAVATGLGEGTDGVGLGD